MLCLRTSIKHHRQASCLQQQPWLSHDMLPGYAMALMWESTSGCLTCSKGLRLSHDMLPGYAMAATWEITCGCLTCSKGLVHLSGDGESLVGASPQHTLQLGHQHDRLQCRHLGGHQLAHTQLVTHHALMGFQSGFQLRHRQTVG